MLTSFKDEMRDLALKTNTIAFSTLYLESERKEIGNFGAFITNIYEARFRAFEKTSYDYRSLVTQEILAELAEQWPQFVPAEHLHDEWNGPRTPGLQQLIGTTSEFRNFVDHALCLLGTRFAREIHRNDVRRNFPRETFSSLELDPWIILNSTNKKKLPTEIGPHSGGLRDRIQFRYSAAAVAVRYLSSLPPSTRKCIRNITLSEDHEAVAYPECQYRPVDNRVSP